MNKKFEDAVLCSLNPDTDASTRQSALQYCEELKSLPDSWKLALSMFVEPRYKILMFSNNVQVRFFALQLLEYFVHYQKLDNDSFLVIKSSLMAFIQQSLKEQTCTLFLTFSFVEQVGVSFL